MDAKEVDSTHPLDKPFILVGCGLFCALFTTLGFVAFAIQNSDSGNPACGCNYCNCVELENDEDKHENGKSD